jgi:DNA-binding MarR family transcriptional regulator
MTAAAHATAPPASASPEAIAAALHRLDLAAVRRRAVVARGLDLSGVELLAIEHVERAGALSPGELSACLQLSSGGTTKLIQRLQRTGHLSRSPDGTDGRRAYVRVAPAARRSIAARCADGGCRGSGRSASSRAPVRRSRRCDGRAERHRGPHRRARQGSRGGRPRRSGGPASGSLELTDSPSAKCRMASSDPWPPTAPPRACDRVSLRSWMV